LDEASGIPFGQFRLSSAQVLGGYPAAPTMLRLRKPAQPSVGRRGASLEAEAT